MKNRLVLPTLGATACILVGAAIDFSNLSDAYFGIAAGLYIIGAVLFIPIIASALFAFADRLANQRNITGTDDVTEVQSQILPHGVTILTRVQELNGKEGVVNWSGSERAMLTAYVEGDLGGEIRFASDAGAFALLSGVHDHKDLYPVIGHAEFLTSYTLNPAELPFQPDPPFDMDLGRELFPGQHNITLTPDGCPESI